MVTVTPHLRNAVGVLIVSDDPKKGLFTALVEKETAVPCRRAGVFAVPREGGDVIVKVCEGMRDIKVTKTASKPEANGKAAGDNQDDEDEDDEEEEEEVRERVWKIGTVLAEAAVRGIHKGGKIEVTVNIGADLGVQITAREVGGKGGVRGNLERPKVTENGSA